MDRIFIIKFKSDAASEGLEQYIKNALFEHRINATVDEVTELEDNG
jgi:hypothetical protein